MSKITKPKLLKKGKEVFGSMEKFNKWLNSDNIVLNCKPVSLWDTKNGIETIYSQLIRIEHGILC